MNSRAFIMANELTFLNAIDEENDSCNCGPVLKTHAQNCLTLRNAFYNDFEHS